ncbi:LysR family transcriptional regulator [Limosilactobacillus reuteri]|uniref:LysR family transcriptional regulator n=1 Tax=Limosilactobacillus reuteri TaxID=1598 RepID=A0AAX2SSK8_LIMRT|nr:LysR family transcriptional regulator [Limosilactobacillus reuteri]MCC4399234.1 LysR family transcriptional regulator [Limosilactobacillus reuteri]MCC4404114.1 LysR family transcriptional regulator [Limosilactobacillus reuteri]RMX27932.1 LysR family transcriptional regulator [Limosilactobacillus reuteri]TGB10996.1 LysR family transcriptional regulator [Limosilactobacillus reuteri]
MEINKLKTFIDLANTLNFSETANNLYVSQSSISKQIKSLEKELGHPLFNRNNKKVILSNLGKVILPEACKIVELNEQLITKARRANQYDSNQIKLGVIPSFYHNDIFQKALNYQRQHSQINILLHEEETNNLLELLNRGKFDLVYTRSLKKPAEFSNYDTLLISQERFVVCLNKNHPLAKERDINLQQLKAENFIMLSPNSLLYQPVIDLCHEAGFAPKISFVSERISSLIQMVKGNQGVAIIMQPRPSKVGVVLRPLQPTKTSYLFFAKDRQSTSPVIKKYWEYLQNFAIPKRNS